MKMSKHKHATEIHAWAEGYTVQHKVHLCCEHPDTADWEDCTVTPGWYEDREYRIKPIEDESKRA